MIFRKSSAAGILMILLGLLIPGRLLIQSLRRIPEDPTLSAQLLTGAFLFKAGLILLGLVLIALGLPSIKRALDWSGSDPTRKEPDRYAFILIALLVLSFGLRLYKLGEGLWLDEIGMYLKYLERPFGELLTTYDSENQHFLYTIMAHIAVRLSGDTAWGMRFPAVLFGVGGIWALYLLGKEVASRKEALLASALLSLSYYHVWFSQNARGYSGLLFWTLLSSWYFVRAISGGPTRLWIYYAASIALGAYTQLVMIFVAAAHFLIYLHHAFLKKQNNIWWSGLVAGFVLAGLFTFQLYALVLPQFFTTIGMKGTVAIWNSPLWTLSEIIRGLKVSFAGGFVALAATAVFLAGLWSYKKTRPVLLALLFVPPVLGSIVVIALGHPLWPRFYFFAFGFGALVVIRGGMVLGQWIRSIGTNMPEKWTAESVGILICGSFIAVSAISIPRAYLPKQDFAGALSFIETNRQPADNVVTVGRISAPYAHFYKTDFQEVRSVERLEEIRREANRTWLLYMIPEDVAFVYPEIMANIRNNFRVVREFPSPLADGAIFVCVDD